MITIDKVVKRYIELRDEIEKIQAEADEKINARKEQQLKLESWVLNKANTEKWENQKTAYGTVFITNVDYASVEDWQTVLEYVKQNELWELLTHGVSKLEIRNFIEQHKLVPPGVKYAVRKAPRFNRPRVNKTVLDDKGN